MKSRRLKSLLFTICLGSLLTLHSVGAQPAVAQPTLNYYELKGMLQKHKASVESMLRLKRFTLASTKERPESIIYGYQKANNTTQVLVRVRKSDGRVSEIAWHEGSETLGSLTHDAVYDGFVPVAGNSHYYNRFQKMALHVNYKLADDEAVPCILKAVE